MKFIILTEGGKKFGLGHVSRCTSFYDAIKEKGHEVSFIIQGDESINTIIENRHFIFLNWHEDFYIFLNKFTNYDFLIIDSYHITQNQVDLLIQSECKLVAIEDYVHRNYKDAIIIDWSINANKSNFYLNKHNSNQYLLGLSFVALRKPFWTGIDTFKKNNSSIMVTLGGADNRHLSKDIIIALINEFPNFNINLVIGSAFANIKELTNISSDGLNIFLSPNASEMKKIMEESAIAITGGGQTLYELALKQVFIITVELADNQHEEINEWAKQGGLIYVGKWSDSNLINNILNAVSFYLKNKNNSQADSIQNIGIDGKGIFRILDVVLANNLNENRLKVLKS